MTRTEDPPVATSAERRRFLSSAAGAACGAALVAGGVGLYATQARALPASALRPPGAIAEDRFTAACVRCGLCVRACPYDTLRLARLGDGVVSGTPFFVGREIPCEMCADLPCVVACPTAALDKGLTDVDQARMGLAVLTDLERCLSALGLRCEVCYRACPVIDKAITLERRHNPRSDKHALFIPVVHSDACTGCGKCEKACVLEQTAIRVLPRSQAQAQLGAHYRVGWEEKLKAGGPLVPPPLELPVRRPEAKP